VGSYHKWEIYALKRREVADELERVRIHNRMMYVLTGDQKYQMESQVASAMAATQKRKQRRRKRGNTFFRRPDRSLTVKRQRRAFASRAEATREPEPGHPLMIVEPLKADEDVAMDEEEDEIHQEDANTALVEDDQGIDYDIDQYLDDPSKAFHILIP
jgi:hypothetical protein